jgi:flagellar biosynthesis protein FlhA
MTSTVNKKSTFVDGLVRNTDLAFTIGILAVVLLLVAPVPPVFLDLLLALSVALGFLMLLVVIYVAEPAEFSVFPTLLLAVTLYRLALNVASTRLILLDGFAGHIIQSFGNFVVKGNYVVGSVVFVILVIINFIVITKGSGRIAEVAARFTLDAMPGKQMAIDAELNAGIIDEATATQRRRKIQKEADFYGAMDGASKFVRGDAIAGILITFVNIVGGIAIGVLQKKMPLHQALEHYTLLSIGDGLVSQIPALIVSVGAGILVTRTSEGLDLGTHLGRQILFYPKAIAVAAGMMLLFAILPGMPTAPFLLLGTGFGLVARFLSKKPTSVSQEKPFEEVLAGHGKAKPQAPTAPVPGSVEELQKMIQVERFVVELGGSLLCLVDAKASGDLLDRITGFRQKFAKDMGLIIPPIAVRDNLEVDPCEYRFILKNKEVGRGRLMPQHWLAMNVNASSYLLKGTPTVEPVFGLEAVWVDATDKQQAEIHGYTVVEPASVLITHLTEVVKDNASWFLEREDTQKLIDTVKEKNPTLVSELLPDLVTVGIIQRVLQNLLAEKLPIKQLTTILEAVADYAPVSKNPDDISEQVRRRLSPFFIQNLEATPNFIHAVTLDPSLEQLLVTRIKKTPLEVSLMMDPALTHHILEHLSGHLSAMVQKNLEPIVIVGTDIRLAFKRFFEPLFPKMHVLAYQELPRQTQVQSAGILLLPPPEKSNLPASMLLVQ